MPIINSSFTQTGIVCKTQLALLGPGRYNPTLDDVPVSKDPKIPVEGWAAVRSQDANFFYGAITAKSKVNMGIAMGVCSDMSNEIERKHNTLLACPVAVREGEFNTLSLIVQFLFT